MIKANADHWFSWAVRAAAGWKCQKCGASFEPPTRVLQCNHLFSRKHNITRWFAGTDEIASNAHAHCASCHAWLESRPPEHVAWAMEHEGEERYNALRRYHNRIAKFSKSDFATIAAHYKNEYNRITEQEYGFNHPQKLENHPVVTESNDD